LAHLLIVDDDANTLASLARAFRLAGHEATVCDNAARALELVKSQPFDMMMSDVVMPGKDGLTLLEELRNLVAQVQGTVQRVTETTGEVEATSTELLAASDEQLREIRETGESVLQMAGRINEVSAQAQHSAEVARQCRVSCQSATRWLASWKKGGEVALKKAPRAGRPPRLSADDFERLKSLLAKPLQIDTIGRKGYRGDRETTKWRAGASIPECEWCRVMTTQSLWSAWSVARCSIRTSFATWSWRRRVRCRARKPMGEARAA